MKRFNIIKLKSRKIKLGLSLIIAITLFMINSLVVFGAEPALPTSIYGKVLNNNKEPAINVDVSVVWVDSDGNERITSTKTLSEEEAGALGDGSLVENYLFNQGYVKAKLNSEINIIINGHAFEKFNSNPGGIVKVRDAILSSKGSSSRSATGIGTGSSEGEGTGTEGDGKGTEWDGKGTEGDGSGGSADAKGSDSPSSSDFAGSVPVPDTGSSTDYSESAVNPTLPTSIAGQLVDEDNNPIGDEFVTAEWTDELGVKHTTTTKTLSKKEAKELGNKSLEGFYRFNDGSIKAKPNSTISIKHKNQTFTRIVSSKPGETTKAEKLQLFGAPERKQEGIAASINRIINSSGDIILGNIKEPPKNLSKLVAPLIFIALLASFYFVKYKKRKQKGPLIADNLYKDMSSLGSKKVEKYMTREVITISENDPIFTALEIMVTKGINSIVVVKNQKPIGIISERDFIKKVYNNKNNWNALKARDVMTSPLITASKDLDLYACIELIIKQKIRKLPVINNEKLVGIIAITGILEIFNQFFSKNIIESSSIPTVKSVYSKRIARTTKETKLPSVCNYMTQYDVDYSIVYDNLIDINQSKASGIVTSKDLLDEFYKNPYGWEELKMMHIMKSPIGSTKPGSDIIEANSFMLEKNFRRMFVIANNQIVGILTQLALLESIYTFIKDTLKIMGKNKTNIDIAYPNRSKLQGIKPIKE